MSFSKDQYGRYKLDQYQAAFKSDAHPQQNRKQTFIVDAGHQTNPAQAFNLLEGRAVQYEYVNAAGGKQSVWVKLDFNDKDNAGNFRQREYPLYEPYGVIESIVYFDPSRGRNGYRTNLMAATTKFNLETDEIIWDDKGTTDAVFQILRVD